MAPIRHCAGRWALILLAYTVAGCGELSAGTGTPFDGTRAYADVEAVVAIGARYPGSPGAERTRIHIRDAVEAAGLTVETRAFDAETPLGTIAMANVVAVCEGTKPGIIVLSGHYDTKYLPYVEGFVGANDAGSSTGWLIEMARALGPKRDGRTVWLVWFDGEEALETWSRTDSLYGSREMVRTLQEENAVSQVHAMINVDMIGDCNLNVLRDPKAPDWLLQLLLESARASGHLDAFDSTAKSMEDDHLPFREAGVPAINLIDFEYGRNAIEHDYNWHTARDTLDKVCADSLQAIGDTLWYALPELDRHLDEGGYAR